MKLVQPELETDASDFAMGVVLLQLCEDER